MVKMMACVEALRAAGLVALGFAILIGSNNPEVGLLLGILGGVLVITFVPSYSAWVLFKGGTARQAKGAISANVSLNALCILGVVGALMNGHWNTLAIVAFVIVPQWLSARALKRVRNNLEASPSEVSVADVPAVAT